MLLLSVSEVISKSHLVWVGPQQIPSFLLVPHYRRNNVIQGFGLSVVFDFCSVSESPGNFFSKHLPEPWFQGFWFLKWAYIFVIILFLLRWKIFLIIIKIKNYQSISWLSTGHSLDINVMSTHEALHKMAPDHLSEGISPLLTLQPYWSLACARNVAHASVPDTPAAQSRNLTPAALGFEFLVRLPLLW